MAKHGCSFIHPTCKDGRTYSRTAGANSAHSLRRMGAEMDIETLSLLLDYIDAAIDNAKADVLQRDQGEYRRRELARQELRAHVEESQ